MKCIARSRNLFLLSAFFWVSLLSGCVAKQTIPYSYSPQNYALQKINSLVEVSVKDERDFILTQKKEDSYIGHFRGGYGNTWDVKTKGHVPLAEQFRKDLESELRTLGADGKNAGRKKILGVIIRDYNFDAYINGRFWYKFELSVRDDQGNLLAEEKIENEHVIKGSFWIGPVGAFKREMPVLHEQVVHSLVRDNEKILKALQS